jgi:hypothetical protein
MRTRNHLYRRLAAILAATAGGGLLPVAGPAGAASALPLPGEVGSVAVAVSGDDAALAWTPPAGGAPGGYQLTAWVDGAFYGERIAPPGATSATWDRLPLNQDARFTVAAVGEQAGGEPGLMGPVALAPVVTATDPRCPASTAGDCVVVDPSTPEGVETHPASGLLHGTVPAGSPWVAPLHLTHWRIQAGNPTQYAEATAAVPAQGVIEVLSDDWYGATAHYELGVGPVAADPWANWSAYSDFIENAVRSAEAAGQDPYWEIQNEPENYPYDPAEPPTRPRVEQEYLEAYQAIKAVDPAARVIGPTIDWQYSSAASPWYVDMATFIPFAAANHMQLAAIAWHDNFDATDTDPVSYSETPEAVRDQAEIVRTLVAENPGIGDPALFVDENSSAAGQFSPGWEAAYAAEDDRAGLALAGRSCWPYPEDPSANYCFGPYLDQLLNLDGVPNASYWVMADYATLDGERVWSATNDANLSSLAVSDSSGTTRILLGRHQTCSGWTAGAAACPATTPPPTVPVQVVVAVPAGSDAATVTVQRLADTRADLATAPATSTSREAVENATVTVALPAFADGDAWFVTVTADEPLGSGQGSGSKAPAAVAAPAATGSTYSADGQVWVHHGLGPAGPAAAGPAPTGPAGGAAARSTGAGPAPLGPIDLSAIRRPGAQLERPPDALAGIGALAGLELAAVAVALGWAGWGRRRRDRVPDPATGHRTG